MNLPAMNLPVSIENINLENAPSVYIQGGLTQFLDHIKSEVVGEVPDLTTKKGRDRIASLAAQVSRSKSAIEKPGRDYLRHIKELPKIVEAELRDFVRECDTLRDQIRAPLTEWEQAEEARIDGHKLRISELKDLLHCEFACSNDVSLKICEIGVGINPAEYEEFLSDFLEAREHALVHLNKLYNDLEASEIAAEEAERKRLEQEERNRLERERLIAENARLAAEREALEREKKLAEQVERDKKEAVEREERLKREASEREMRIKIEAEMREKQLKENAEREKLEAINAERKRAEDEIRREQMRIASEKAEAERIASNRNHQLKINRDILDRLITIGISEDNAKTIIKAAAKMQLGKMVINY